MIARNRRRILLRIGAGAAMPGADCCPGDAKPPGLPLPQPKESWKRCFKQI